MMKKIVISYMITIAIIVACCSLASAEVKLDALIFTSVITFLMTPLGIGLSWIDWNDIQSVADRMFPVVMFNLLPAALWALIFITK